MVDYYLLLSRAVEGIPPSMPGARQALYERARKILVTELQGEPPAREADIAAERRSLEDAITRVEGELTRLPAPVIQIASGTSAGDGEAANSPPALPASITQTSSRQDNQEKPTLTELLRIVDDAMKEPAPLPPARGLEHAVASTPLGRAVSRSSGFGETAGLTKGVSTGGRAPRTLQAPRERQQSAGPELRLLVGRSSRAEQERSAPNKADLDKILRNLQVTSPGIEASALISKGGLMIASAMAPRMDETRVAGVTATLLKLGARASVELARGEVQEVIVRADHGYAVMIGAGHGALLLALANESSTLGYIFFGMQETVKALENVL